MINNIILNFHNLNYILKKIYKYKKLLYNHTDKNDNIYTISLLSYVLDKI